jgi:hypothetical protein
MEFPIDDFVAQLATEAARYNPHGSDMVLCHGDNAMMFELPNEVSARYAIWVEGPSVTNHRVLRPLPKDLLKTAQDLWEDAMI